MSLKCHCPFSGPSDTILGCHRDPITSEKLWLDFAVRELSRAAAGKARGQEAVWRSQCKPDWWERECSHPWKNPTANPKDSKDTLKAKFECLVQHLRKTGQLPREMEEEISLWESDRKAEVFLMTAFSSLLGQASNVHSLVEDTCQKMEESSTSVDPSILADLLKCLTASAAKLQTVMDRAEKRKLQEGPGSASGAGSKRRRCDTDSDSCPQPVSKHLKRSPPLPAPPLSSPSPTPSFVPSPPPTQPSTPLAAGTLASIDRSSVAIALLQKQLLQKRVRNPAEKRPLVCRVPKTQTLQNPNTCPFLSHKAVGPVEGRKGGVGHNSVAEDTIAAAPPSVYLSPTIPIQSSSSDNHGEIADLLPDLGDLDSMEDCPILNDHQFLDDLLRDSPDMGVDVDPTAVISSSVTSPSSSLSPPSSQLPAHCQNDNENLSIHDPLISRPLPSELPLSVPFYFGAAERQAEVDSEEGDFGTALWSGVGKEQDLEVVSESGYNSESSVASSLRNSLDSEVSEEVCFSDLASPGLEALLKSLDIP